MSNIIFTEFQKIPRLSRDMVITEKIDGTNSCICITEDGEFLTGSRHKWITPENDNYGFSQWAHEHKEELMKLGTGTHYGEWWGSGIQRGYGLKEKRFSLFNTSRWGDTLIRPVCCSVVPVLYTGLFDTNTILEVMKQLLEHGSYAAEGFMDPEGIVIFHVAGNHLYKKTFKNDSTGKEMR